MAPVRARPSVAFIPYQQSAERPLLGERLRYPMAPVRSTRDAGIAVLFVRSGGKKSRTPDGQLKTLPVSAPPPAATSASLSVGAEI